MRILVFAGLITAAMAPAALADTGLPCQVDNTRRVLDHVITEAESGSAPPTAVATAQTIVRPAVVQREAAAVQNQRTPAQQQQRRRSGKRIPDAELIGPRGAL
jgi:hypothetical protein